MCLRIGNLHARKQSRHRLASFVRCSHVRCGRIHRSCSMSGCQHHRRPGRCSRYVVVGTRERCVPLRHSCSKSWTCPFRRPCPCSRHVVVGSRERCVPLRRSYNTILLLTSFLVDIGSERVFLVNRTGITIGHDACMLRACLSRVGTREDQDNFFN